MKNLKMLIILALVGFNIYLVDQIINTVGALNTCQSSYKEDTITKRPYPQELSSTLKQESKTIVQKEPVPYDKDITWSKKYVKTGNRNKRYAIKKIIPVFSSKWMTWTGKQYINRNELEKLVISVVSRLPHVKNEKNTINLIVETAIAESVGGYYTDSKNGDYGIFQIRQYVAKENLNWLKLMHKDVYDIICKLQNPKLSLAENLAQNIPFGIAICISEYWRKVGPDFAKYITTKKDRAIMWKSVYNTKFGLGTVVAYISRNDYYERNKR